MFKEAAARIAERREEIINACEQLYQTMSFREITLKEIGNVTSFSRPTIYNYFETKEEIFLALFEREYDRWNEALSEILSSSASLTKDELAAKIAASLIDRIQLLKLLSMNTYDMEANSRPEMLTSFKKAYGQAIRNIRQLLAKFCPEMNADAAHTFIYLFFPFLFGVYPYTAVTDKQKTAMAEAGVDYMPLSVYDLTYTCLIRLLP